MRKNGRGKNHKNLWSNPNPDDRRTVEINLINNGINFVYPRRPDPLTAYPPTELFLQQRSGKSESVKMEPDPLIGTNKVRDGISTNKELNHGIVAGILQLNLLGEIILLDLSQSFQKQMKEMQSIFKEKEFLSWNHELTKLLKYLERNTQDLIRGGKSGLEILQQELINELLALPPLEQFYVSEGKTVEMDESLRSLLQALKEDVKKGNRANFKGLQEIETRFEQFFEQVQGDHQEVVREAVQDMKNQNNNLRNLAFEMIDQLDSVYQAVLQSGNEAFSKQVEKIIEKSILTLDSFGFEEIDVLGKFIDGKTMISLGNVSRQQYAPHLDQYQVYSVHKRGFRDKKTKEIVRKATVITVD